MDFLQKLDDMMRRTSLNKRTLSQNSGIPYTTIDGWYKKGYDGMKISTLRMLAKYFRTTLDFWFQDDIANSGEIESSPEDTLRSTLLLNFDQLNPEGQERLVETSDDMVESGKYIKNNKDKLGKAQNE